MTNILDILGPVAVGRVFAGLGQRPTVLSYFLCQQHFHQKRPTNTTKETYLHTAFGRETVDVCLAFLYEVSLDSSLVSLDSSLVSLDSSLVSLDSSLVSLDSSLVSLDSTDLGRETVDVCLAFLYQVLRNSEYFVEVC